MKTNLDQVIYGEDDQTSRESLLVLIGREFSLYKTAPMPAGLGTDTIIGSPIRLPLGGWQQLHAYLIVTAAAAAAGDKLDLYIDSSMDDGASWFNVIHFAQIIGTASVPYQALAATNVTAATYANVTNDISAGATPGAWSGDHLRLRATLVNAGGAMFTFGVYGEVHG
jgi:hypothetical protein